MNWTYKEYLCTEEGCGKIFNTKWTLKRHSATHQQTANVTYNCEKCEKNFSRKDSLDRHNQMCHSNMLLMYVCSEEGCGKLFSLKSTLCRHKSSHTDCYKCKECGSSFTRKDNLTRHKTIHTRKQEEPTQSIVKSTNKPKSILTLEDIVKIGKLETMECNVGKYDHTYALLES